MTTGLERAPATPTTDDRLGRLFDYTKWHIGIYLGLGGGLVTLLGSRDGSEFLCRLFSLPWMTGAALGAMLIAGIAGGIVASAATRCRTFEELWREPRPVYGLHTFTGETWAAIEHSAFWLGLALLAGSVLLPAPSRPNCCQTLCPPLASSAPQAK